MVAERPDEVLSSDARPSSVISDDIFSLREKNLASPPLRARRSTQREKKRTVCGAKPLADNQADLEEAVLARVRGRLYLIFCNRSITNFDSLLLLIEGENGRGATG